MSIDDIRNLALVKKEQLNNAAENLDKINSVIGLLKDDMCFFKVDINIMIPILLYLGVSEENVKDVYFSLINADNFKQKYDIRTCIGK